MYIISLIVGNIGYIYMAHNIFLILWLLVILYDLLIIYSNHELFMTPNIQKLFSVWEQTAVISKVKTIVSDFKLDEIVSNIFTSGPSYYYIIDFYDMSLSHISPFIKDIHGLNPETLTFNDILKQIHPDDMDHVAKAEAFCVEYFTGKMWDKITSYKLCYSFRFKVADGSYKMFLHQALTISVDETGSSASVLNIHTDISHLTNENNYKISFIGLRGEPSYINLSYGDNPLEDVLIFTKREVEIIKLIAEGKTSKSIAVLLHISLHTVKNHRKNILHKSSCKNMGELVAKCMVKGVI